MKWAGLAVLGAIALSTGGCVLGCDDSLQFGLGVTVYASDRTQLCDAKVTAIDGDYVEVLEVSNPDGPRCSYFGAPERSGEYRIVVEKDGFETEVMEKVEVDDGMCHVDGASVEVTLNEVT